MYTVCDAVPAVRKCELANRKRHVCPDIVHRLKAPHRWGMKPEGTELYTPALKCSLTPIDGLTILQLLIFLVSLETGIPRRSSISWPLGLGSFSSSLRGLVGGWGAAVVYCVLVKPFKTAVVKDYINRVWKRDGKRLRRRTRHTGNKTEKAFSSTDNVKRSRPLFSVCFAAF